MKLYIGTPAFGGNVDRNFATSLALTCSSLLLGGIEYVLDVIKATSLLPVSRNYLLRRFYESDCTHALFIDADLGWSYLSVEKMMNADVDVIAGLYPIKGQPGFYFVEPILNDDKSLVNNGNNLYKMLYVPAGFVMITKKVVNTLFDKFKDRRYSQRGDPSDWAIAVFDNELKDQEYWGEDYVFSRRLREAGFDIWVDPTVHFNHGGTEGSFQELLVELKDESKSKAALH